MALGTGPDALVSLLQDNWQDSRTGRGDIPDVVRDSDGDPSSDPRDGEGVLILKNREKRGINQSQNDIVHVYHPEANPPTNTDRGYKEKRVVENVQIDIDVTDRTDHDTDPPTRLDADTRLLGDREDLADTGGPPYGGISGEVEYILETVRRGFEEWDRVAADPVNLRIGTANASISWNVELFQLATNTVQ